MTETLRVTSERVDDIPLLLTQLEHMGVQPLLDQHFPTHGNWQGLSLGWVTVIWLTHILSEADHRLNQVQSWAEQRLETLRRSTGQPVRALDLGDDRLGEVVRALSEDTSWEEFEDGLNQHLLRVYKLSECGTPAGGNLQGVRLDSTTASGYWSVTEDGIFQLGHSKDRRPDLPQVKIMLSTLDPLGLPLVTEVLPGQRADDPLYTPAITRVRASLGRRGLLYIGDCKMGALQTRAFTHAGGDFYLCPLAETQLSPEQLQGYLTPVWSGEQPLTDIYQETEEGAPEPIAQCYERLEQLTAIVANQSITWEERRLLVRSLKQAQAKEATLRVRLGKAQAAVARLNERGRGKQRFSEVASLRQAAEALVQRYQVPGLLRLSYAEEVMERPLRRYRERPAGVRVEREVQVSAVVDEGALQAVIERAGWRVYATNTPPEQLSPTQAVLAYRSQYIIDRGMHRLKGRPLSLTPMYLQRDDHVTGLVRLLSIGLRVLTLLEFAVRAGLGKAGGKVMGLYAGNPKRATARPTTERLLEAFQNITLTVIEEPDQTRRHLTPLSALQHRILGLLDFSAAIYTRLLTDSAKPP